MDARGISARLNDLDALPRRSLIAVLLLAVFGVAMWSLTSQSPEFPAALWWPAIGVAYFAVLASRGRRLAVLAPFVVLLTVANLLGGRTLDLAIAYSVGNAVEVWLAVWLLTRGHRHAEFTTLSHIIRFVWSIAVAAIALAIIVAGSAAVVLGIDPIAFGLSVYTSHASSLYVIAPLALVPLTVPLRATWWEAMAQSVTLAVLIFVVFVLFPTYSLTFFIITTFIWGAYRLPPVVPVVQSLVMGLITVALTTQGDGPFGLLIADDLRGGVLAVQLFMLTHAVASSYASGQSADWNATTEALAAREREATQVADEQRELSRQKDYFIASVSHELRTPVTSILGFAEDLTEPGQAAADPAFAGRIIFRNARRLADVIEDVLELSELSTYVGRRPPTELDACRLLAECVEDTIGLVLPAQKVSVDLRVPENPVIVWGDEQDFVRVFSNLLSNAVKFSPAGGIVTVTLTESSDDVEIRIEDQGPGIPREEQEAVWERFYRVQSDRHRDVPGTGLGLPIVRALVTQRFGGQVELHSDGEHGTTMMVRVPRRRVTQVPPGFATEEYLIN